MRRDLLIDLRDALLKVSKEGMPEGFIFNMNHFWKKDRKHPECRTQCCAYGLGTMLPSWQAAGLTLNKETGYFSEQNARDVLGLTLEQFDSIFYGVGRNKGLSLSLISVEEVVCWINELLEKENE